MAFIRTKVIRSRDWNRDDPTFLGAEAYKWRLLCEGDSWLDVSGPTTNSLPAHLSFDGVSSIAINCSQAGDELRGIVDCLEDGDFLGWLEPNSPVNFHGILLSIGGNDLIAAGRYVPLGAGILNICDGSETDEMQCVRVENLAKLGAMLDTNFQQLHSEIRGRVNGASLPIFLNLYSVPVARPAPATVIGKSWLWEAYQAHHVPIALYQRLTAFLFHTLQSQIRAWPSMLGDEDLILVPTDIVSLTPAASGSTSSDGDWLNEIHPNKAGCEKLSRMWEIKLLEKGIGT